MLAIQACSFDPSASLVMPCVLHASLRHKDRAKIAAQSVMVKCPIWTPASKWPKVSGQTTQGCAVAQTLCPLCPLRRLFMSAHALSGPSRYGLQLVPRGPHRPYTGGGTPGCRGVRPPVQRHRAPPPRPPRASRRAPRNQFGGRGMPHRQDDDVDVDVPKARRREEGPEGLHLAKTIRRATSSAGGGTDMALPGVRQRPAIRIGPACASVQKPTVWK